MVFSLKSRKLGLIELFESLPDDFLGTFERSKVSLTISWAFSNASKLLPLAGRTFPDVRKSPRREIGDFRRFESRLAGGAALPDGLPPSNHDAAASPFGSGVGSSPPLCFAGWAATSL